MSKSRPNVKPFFVEPLGKPQHGEIVWYVSADNVIRYYLPKQAPGEYMIHEMNPDNPYARSLRITPAYRRAS